MKRELVINRLASILFWTFLLAFLSVCVYYMIHNAHWLIGDEAIVMDHTGKGRPFLPTGFEDMAKNYGRLYPFAYNLYDILLLFHSGYISLRIITSYIQSHLLYFRCLLSQSLF